MNVLYGRGKARENEIKAIGVLAKRVENHAGGEFGEEIGGFLRHDFVVFGQVFEGV